MLRTYPFRKLGLLAAALACMALAGCGASGGGSTTPQPVAAGSPPAASSTGGQPSGGASSTGRSGGGGADVATPGSLGTTQYASLTEAHSSLSNTGLPEPKGSGLSQPQGSGLEHGGDGSTHASSAAPQTSAGSSSPSASQANAPSSSSASGTPSSTGGGTPEIRTVVRDRIRVRVEYRTRTVIQRVPVEVWPQVPAGAHLPSKHAAYVLDRFATSSGNVVCQLVFGDARCVAVHRVWTTPQMPKSCRTEQTAELAVGQKSAAAFTCGSERLLGMRAAIVPDGYDVTYASVTCQVRRTGVTCFEPDGHGFSIGRTGYTIF